jgi:trehalose synthase
MQRALREGFGLAASEALWKRTPVVAGRGGGIELQVDDGETGYVVDDTAEMGERVADLVEDPGLATEMGSAGRLRVQQRFLVTRLLEDELRLLQSVAGEGPGTLTA